MIDALHDDLLSNIAILLGNSSNSRSREIDTLEAMFIAALEHLAKNEDQLTDVDWHLISRWLVETDEYFKGYDFAVARLCLPDGRQITDLGPFVAKARTFL